MGGVGGEGGGEVRVAVRVRMCRGGRQGGGGVGRCALGGRESIGTAVNALAALSSKARALRDPCPKNYVEIRNSTAVIPISV